MVRYLRPACRVNTSTGSDSDYKTDIFGNSDLIILNSELIRSKKRKKRSEEVIQNGFYLC